MAQKRATSTEAVVNAAARVFLEKGFEVSTIEDVAREASVSKPTVYQYAKSKQWLLDEIVRLMCQDMEMAQLRLHSDPAPPIVRLHWIIELNIELAVEYRNSYRVTLSEQTALSLAARDEFRLWARRTTTRFAELLSECRQDGSFTWNGDIMVAANLIISMLTSAHRWFHPRGNESSATATLGRQVSDLLSGAIARADMSSWPRPETRVMPYKIAAEA